MRWMITALLLTLQTFPLYAQTIPVVLERMELDLAVDYDAERIDGTARLTVSNVSDGSVREIPLLLNRLMKIKRASASSGATLPVEQNVVIFDDDSKWQTLFATITLARPLARGARTTIDVAYGGHVAGYTETGNRYVHDRIAEEYSMIRADAYSFPVVGLPSLKKLRAAKRSDFTFAVRIDVPTSYVVAAGGELVGTKKTNGRTTFHYASEVGAPFLYIAVAKFGILENNGVRIYHLLKDEAGAKTVMDRAQKALALYQTWFGALTLPPKFTIIEIPSGWGPQASLIAGIIQTEEVFRDPDYLYSLDHEIGHFWNVPDKDVPSPRWNEGLSTWFQEVVVEAIEGKPNPKFAPWVAERKLEEIARRPQLLNVPLKDYGKELMTDDSYGVGYLYFHILDKVIGRDQLLAVLRDYYQTNKTRGATLRDFLTLLESRHPEVRAIDEDWIETTAWAAKLQQAQSIDELVASYMTERARPKPRPS